MLSDEGGASCRDGPEAGDVSRREADRHPDLAAGRIQQTRHHHQDHPAFRPAGGCRYAAHTPEPLPMRRRANGSSALPAGGNSPITILTTKAGTTEKLISAVPRMSVGGQQVGYRLRPRPRGQVRRLQVFTPLCVCVWSGGAERSPRDGGHHRQNRPDERTQTGAYSRRRQTRRHHAGRQGNHR